MPDSHQRVRNVPLFLPLTGDHPIKLPLPALAAVIVLAGCTASPTDSPLREPFSARFSEGTADGGNGLGSSNDAGHGQTTAGSGPLEGDSTGAGTHRGGNMLGSGN